MRLPVSGLVSSSFRGIVPALRGGAMCLLRGIVPALRGGAMCLLAIAFVLVSHAPLHAQAGMMDTGTIGDDQARARFKVGKSLYETGRFAEAAAEWEQAYSLSQKAPILYNLYVAYRDASDLPKATDALRRYLATDEVNSEQRVNLEARLRVMEEANSRNPSAAPAEAPRESAATAAPVEAAPLPDAAPSAGAAALPPPAPPESHSSVLPYVLLGTGGALIVAGIITGAIGSGKVSDIADHCPDHSCPPDYDLNGQRDGARSMRTATVVLAGVGVIAAGAGAVLLLLPGSSQTDRTRDTPTASNRGIAPALRGGAISFACLPGACMGTLRGRF